MLKLLFILIYFHIVNSKFRTWCESCICDTPYTIICNTNNVEIIPKTISHQIRVLEITAQTFENPSFGINTFFNYHHVKTLSIEGTNLEIIYPKSFMHMRKLNNLHLAFNKIHLIKSEAFSQLALNSLTLDYNYNLKFERNVFKNIKSLNYLSLSFCGLKVLDFYTFRHVIFKLETLFLHNNSLTVINQHFENAFSNISKLTELTLGSNPIECSCEKSLWLSHTLRLRHITLKRNTIVEKYYYPTCNNIPFWELSIAHFYCDGPRITKVNILQFPKHMLISCSAYADPESSTFSWFDGTDQIEQSKILIFFNRNNTITSSLKIPYSLYDRQFTCKVQSKNNKSVSGFIFVQKAKVSALDDIKIFWFIIVIIVCISLSMTIISAQCICARMCQRRHRRRDTHPAEARMSRPESMLLPYASSTVANVGMQQQSLLEPRFPPPPPPPMTSDTLLEPRFPAPSIPMSSDSVYYDYCMSN